VSGNTRRIATADKLFSILAAGSTGVLRPAGTHPAMARVEDPEGGMQFGQGAGLKHAAQPEFEDKDEHSLSAVATAL
jgi:hypothetical protein